MCGEFVCVCDGLGVHSHGNLGVWEGRVRKVDVIIPNTAPSVTQHHETLHSLALNLM